jgi:hypothetical protein
LEDADLERFLIMDGDGDTIETADTKEDALEQAKSLTEDAEGDGGDDLFVVYEAIFAVRNGVPPVEVLSK